MNSGEIGQGEDFFQKLSRTASVRNPGKQGKQGTPRAKGAQAEFRDTIHRVHASQDVGSGCEPVQEDPVSPRGPTEEKRKLVIILVGLPGRGKTYLCNKLMCYLNWYDLLLSQPMCASQVVRCTFRTPTAVRRLGHKTRHFNVGAYRRQIRLPLDEEHEHGDAVQDANFFDHTNKVCECAQCARNVAFKPAK